jgi:cytochrome c oxidase subunit 4
MIPQHNLQPQKEKSPKRGVGKYLFSFLWMMVFTAIAFYLVAKPIFNSNVTFWLITVLAVFQVILQLFTFMHLDEKENGIVTVFLGVGILIAVVSAVGIIVM